MTIWRGGEEGRGLVVKLEEVPFGRTCICARARSHHQWSAYKAQGGYQSKLRGF